MSLLEAFILALVEGLTEFLPISSTGHLVVTEALLGIPSTDFVKAFTVIIQFGAILSVIVLYWRRFFSFSLPPDLEGTQVPRWRKVMGRMRFYLLLLVGLLPAAVLGALFDDWVDDMLGKVWVIAINLIVGGVVMLFVDEWLRERAKEEQVTYKKAFMVGLFQCIAIFFPGASRSMSTIVGGMTQRLSRKSAAEFSFFLAVPTMFGATLLKVYKLWEESGGAIFREHLGVLLVGNIVSFVVAIIAIRSFVAYLSKHGFFAFGVYRILFGGLVLLLTFFGELWV